MGGANPTPQSQIVETSAKIMSPLDPAKVIMPLDTAAEMPYYGDTKPMLTPSNYKPALEIIPKKSVTERPVSELISPLDPSVVISDAQKEAATYDRLEKQGMSDQGIVSLPELKKEVVGTAKELGTAINKKIIQPIAEGTANFFGRDASKPMSADDEIEMELRKSELRKK